MDQFIDFDPLEGVIPPEPFYELWKIAADARGMLAAESSDAVRVIEADVDRITFDMQWEMRMIEERKFEGSEEEFEAEYNDISEVDALHIAILCGRCVTSTTEFKATAETACAAVLALMYVADCVKTLRCPEEDLGTHADGPIAARYLWAADRAVNAALALGLAKWCGGREEAKLEADAELEEVARDFNRDRARDAALARHGPTALAKRFVQDAWEKQCDAYDHNKSEFARTYALLVRQKFKNRRGDPLDIKSRTITEMWLSDTSLLAHRAAS